MSHGWFCVFVLATGMASAQSVPTDLQQYLKLTDAQAQSITDLNKQFGNYANTQQNLYYNVQSKAYQALAQDSPAPAAVGDAYGQMEMIRRDYNSQLAQLQSKVGAVLTTDQALLVSGLLSVERLQSIVSEAVCVYLESRVPTPLTRVGDFSPTPAIGVLTPFPLSPFPVQSLCQVPPIPIALTNYLNLTDSQVVAIESAIRGNQDYLSRQSLKIQELQNQIKDLTAAQTIDSAALGAAYVAMYQIQRDETTQTLQLIPSVRSMLTDQQKPQLQALDNAMQLSYTASEAVTLNLLVLPPDVQCPTSNVFSIADPLSSGFGGVLGLPFPSNSCGFPTVIPRSGITSVTP
jgi:hypothetical protein